MNSDAEVHLYLVETAYAAAGVVVRKSVVVDAAPIYRWMVGKKWPVNWPKITRIRKVKK